MLLARNPKRLIASILLCLLLAQSSLQLPEYTVNHDQVAHPGVPTLDHPIVQNSTATNAHNPENLNLSVQPKIGGSEENFTKIQTNVFDSQIVSFVWCRSYNQSLFAMSIKGTIFTTDNHGNDWRNFHSDLEKAGGQSMIEPRIITMIQNEGDRDVIIFYSLSGAAWMTHDCGRSLYLIDGGKKFLSFKFHPTHMQQVLALSRKECPANSICISHNELMLSEDAGKSWRVITSFVYAYEWSKRAEYAFGLGSNAIFVTKQDDKSYDQGVHSTSAKSGVSTYMSWDFFRTETRLIQKGYKFWLSKCCIYVEAFDQHGNRIVYTSEVWNNVFHWKRMKLIRSESEVYTDFHVLHELDSFTPYLVATRMSASNILLSDIFKSDYSRANFSVLLSNVVTSGTVSNPAFQEIPALHGLYVANVYNQDYVKVQQQMNKATKDTINSNLKNFVMTVISFDHGETWTHIRPPTHNNKNVPYDCATCTLNLHLIDDPNFPPLYGVLSAPGVVIGVGSVGEYLNYNYEELGVFISEDGGLTWRHSADGVHMYEIGDQGGLIVMTDFKKTTDLVKFSYDLGRTWFFIKFLDPNQSKAVAGKAIYKAIQVSNIIIEPTNNNHQFLIVGSGLKRKKGYAAHLDFSEYHSRACTGYESPDSSSSDYTRFVPHTYDNEKCFNGISGYYIRKKPEAKCINPDHFTFFKTTSFCKCTDLDWECDNGFLREQGSVVCVQDPHFTLETEPPALCNSYYHVSNGYRKVMGNACQGGVDHSPKYQKCPGHTGFIGAFFGFLWTLIVWLFYGAIGYFAISFGLKKYKEYYLSSKEGSQETKDVNGPGEATSFYNPEKDGKNPVTQYAQIGDKTAPKPHSGEDHEDLDGGSDEEI